MKRYSFICFISLISLMLFCQGLIAQKDTSFVISQDSVFDKYNNQHLGLYADNFNITLLDGSQMSLYDLQCDTLIILFYDPDCSHCKKEIKKLRKDKQLNNQIKAKTTILLTIAPDIDFISWRQTVNKLPKHWLNAWSSDNDLIIKKFLWKVPEKFVLDKRHRIVEIDMYRDYDLED